MTAQSGGKIRAGDTVELRQSAEMSYPYGWKKFRGLSGTVIGSPIGNAVFVMFPGAINKVAVLLHSLQKVQL